jgi:hypothetical protein
MEMGRPNFFSTDFLSYNCLLGGIPLSSMNEHLLWDNSRRLVHQIVFANDRSYLLVPRIIVGLLMAYGEIIGTSVHLIMRNSFKTVKCDIIKIVSRNFCAVSQTMS